MCVLLLSLLLILFFNDINYFHSDDIIYVNAVISSFQEHISRAADVAVLIYPFSQY